MPIQLLCRIRSGQWHFHAIDTADPADVLSIQLVTPDDDLRVRLFFQSMTSQDRYRRFFYPKAKMSSQEFKDEARTDYWSSFRLATVCRATDKFVATATLCGCGNGVVEAAITVLDPYKGRGLGSLLADLLFRAAIEEFQATHLRIDRLISNPAVKHIFNRAAARHSVDCKDGPLEDGVLTATWQLKPAVDVQLELVPLKGDPHDINGFHRKFEVLRPAAHPHSLWRFELHLMVPHEGVNSVLDVRPVTPDDLQRTLAYISALDPTVADWNREKLWDYYQLTREERETTIEAIMRTHYNFGKEFAIATLDRQSDRIVAVARWVDRCGTSHAKALVSMLSSWRGLGIGYFIFDVLIQTAIAEGKQSLTLEVPSEVPKYGDFFGKVAQAHSTKVHQMVDSTTGAWSVEATLKRQVDQPIRLTRLPGVPRDGLHSGALDFV